MNDNFVRIAQCQRVIDGDTVKLVMELGFGVKMLTTCRLLGINAPEMRGANKQQGLASRDYLAELIHRKQPTLQVRSYKTVPWARGKYGRYLVEIFSGGLDINQEMVSAGHAITAVYRAGTIIKRGDTYDDHERKQPERQADHG